MIPCPLAIDIAPVVSLIVTFPSAISGIMLAILNLASSVEPSMTGIGLIYSVCPFVSDSFSMIPLLVALYVTSIGLEVRLNVIASANIPSPAKVVSFNDTLCKPGFIFFIASSSGLIEITPL